LFIYEEPLPPVDTSTKIFGLLSKWDSFICDDWPPPFDTSAELLGLLSIGKEVLELFQQIWGILK
jgi:hypothetical protein